VQHITPVGIEPVNVKFVTPLQDSESNKFQYVYEVFNAEVTVSST